MSWTDPGSKRLERAESGVWSCEVGVSIGRRGVAGGSNDMAKRRQGAAVKTTVSVTVMMSHLYII